MLNSFGVNVGLHLELYSQRQRSNGGFKNGHPPTGPIPEGEARSNKMRKIEGFEKPQTQPKVLTVKEMLQKNEFEWEGQI